MWEPIVAALIGGAARVAGDVGSDALTTSYHALKSYLLRKVEIVDVEKLERDPDNENSRTKVAEALQDLDIEADSELKELTQTLLTKLKAEVAEGPNMVREPKDTPINQPTEILPIFLDMESKSKMISPFMPGPPVPVAKVPVDDLASVLSGEVNNARFTAIINNAHTLRLTVDPEGAGIHAAVNMSELPSINTSSFDFWFQAVDAARAKGPRTLASLLLCLPMGAWLSHGQETFTALLKEQ